MAIRREPDRWLGRTLQVVPDAGLPVFRVARIDDAGVTLQPAVRGGGWRFFDHHVPWEAFGQLLATVLQEC